MKRVPALLAIGFVLITFFRVSAFLQHGMQLGVLGISFAIALTAAVYASAYFTQFKESKGWAIVSLVVFGILDLWFNELEMIRSLSPEQLVVEGSSFLAFDAKTIENLLHISALIYGVAPTICAALLGLLQGSVEKVASLNKRGFFATILVATKATLQKGIKATLEDWFGKEHFAQLSSGKSGNMLPVSDDEVIDADALPEKVRWEDLLAGDKSVIAGMSTRQIVAKWKVSDRTARNWKTRVVAGE